MANGKLLRISVLILLLIGLLFFHSWRQTKNPRPLPPIPQESVYNAPAEIPTPPNPAETAVQPASQGLRLAPSSSNNPTAPAAVANYSYHVKKEHNERQITPGVTYVPGEGLDFKLDAKDQVIHVTNNQLLWQKNF